MKTGKVAPVGYRVIRVLASGEYGSVVLVTHPGKNYLGEPVVCPLVLKVVCVDTQDPTTWTDTEYTILSAFRLGKVPNSVHAAGRVARLKVLPKDVETVISKGKRYPLSAAWHIPPDKVAYDVIAMRYAPGPTLREYLAAAATIALADTGAPGPLNWYVCAKNLVTFAYHAYHEFRVGHGDLKLSNIVVETPGNSPPYLTVVDLSFGRRYAPSAGQVDKVVWQRGTMCFMPPERLFFTARPAWIDDNAAASGDLWAIGTIMATVALTGRQFPAMDKTQQLCVLDNWGRFNPGKTDTVYDLLSTATMPWFHSLVSVISTDSNLPQPFVEHAVKLVLWTAALERECLDCGGGWKPQCTKAVGESARYQALSFYLDHIHSDYAKYGHDIFECVIAVLRQELGTAFKVYLQTQAWLPTGRWSEDLVDNPFASMLATLGGRIFVGETRETRDEEWRAVEKAVQVSDDADMESLIDGLTHDVCTQCGSRTSNQTHRVCVVCLVKGDRKEEQQQQPPLPFYWPFNHLTV